MPILTFINSQGAFGGQLNSRVLIGRGLGYGVALEDQSVSRLHAWIDPVADESEGWLLTDAGSRTGTFVNDRPITRHRLQDSDVIRIGKNLLFFRQQDVLPAMVQPLQWIAPSEVDQRDGILFECACGAPLWVTSELAGKRGMCRHCRQPVTVPMLAAVESIKPPMASAEEAKIEDGLEMEDKSGRADVAATADQSPSPPRTAAEPLGTVPGQQAVVRVSRETRCGVCHSAIVPGDSMVTCSDCAVNYHAECWQENLGCSTYGCPQVSSLGFKAEPTPVATEAQVEPQAAPLQHSLPWELILLAASVLSMLGALLFGALSALVAVAAVVVLARKRPVRSGLLIAAILVSCVGIAVGLAVSDFWYFNARHVPPALARLIHF